MAAPHPYFSLPWAATGDLPRCDETRVRLTSTRPLDPQASADGETITFSANAKRWEVPAWAAPTLRAPENGSACSIKESDEAAGGGHPPRAVRDLLNQLLSQGLIAVAAGD